MKSYMRSMLHEAIKNGNVDTVKAYIMETQMIMK